MKMNKTDTDKLYDMLLLQDMLNREITEDWRAAKYPWYRAAWIECGELMDHHGWKWWKQQTPDIAQVQLEVVDIFHFGLSDALQSDSPLQVVAEQVASQLTAMTEQSTGPILVVTEMLAGSLLTFQSFCFARFGLLMESAGLTLDDLHRQYVAKNVLNVFRQRNGYKDGTYIKAWGNQEDNEFLSGVMANIDIDSPDCVQDLFEILERRYKVIQLKETV